MSGPSTAAHALILLKEVPAVYRTKEGRGRVRMAMIELLRTNLLRKAEVKTGNRNTKLVLQLTQAGLDEVARVRASNPHTPSVTDARAWERASVGTDHSKNLTDATDATHALGTFIFSPDLPSALINDDQVMPLEPEVAVI
jgi:hypothetical protein